MTQELSIISAAVGVDVSTNRSDVIAHLLKGAMGAVPVAGSILAEIISVSIPNQKQERIAECLTIFADKVNYLENVFLEQKMKTEEFADLLEDVIRDASRALSPERLNYLAALLKNSITLEELDHLGHKKILQTLNSLNDVEIIILKYHFIRDSRERDEYQKTHEEIINLRPLSNDPPQEEKTRFLLHRSFHKNIEFLELTPADLTANNYGEVVLRYIDLLD
jgi:hypothetical protein